MSEMEALIRQAESEGKWLWCSYQDLWFSPQELRKAQAEGRFQWGPVNWKLRFPAEKLEAIASKEEALMRERKAFQSRMEAL